MQEMRKEIGALAPSSNCLLIEPTNVPTDYFLYIRVEDILEYLLTKFLFYTLLETNK